MTRPLEGIRGLDLLQGAAGHCCAMRLAALGAEIAKVEPPGGDWGRTLGPPFVDGVATCFLAMNRNKRGAVIDLKKPGGSSIVTRMASLADVVIENFRPGVVERLGIGYSDLSAQNPRLIYLSISAYGRTGPWRDRPGVDGVGQAASGIMRGTGETGPAPVRVGFPLARRAGRCGADSPSRTRREGCSGHRGCLPRCSPGSEPGKVNGSTSRSCNRRWRFNCRCWRCAWQHPGGPDVMAAARRTRHRMKRIEPATGTSWSRPICRNGGFNFAAPLAAPLWRSTAGSKRTRNSWAPAGKTT